MESVLVPNINSNEEFNVENGEPAENLSVGDINEANEKVMNWFTKNLETPAFMNSFDTLSIKSSKASSDDNNDCFKTPSDLSDAEGLNEKYKYVKI